MTHCQLTLCGSLSSNTMCRTNSRPRAGPGGPGVWRPRASSPTPPRHSSCTAARLMSEIRLLPLAHLTSIELARGGQAARRPCSPASSPKQKVEQGGETLDSSQVHFVHLVLYHGGQDLSAALPGLFRAVGLLALQDPHHFPGQPPQPGLPPQPLPRQQAGQ